MKSLKFAKQYMEQPPENKVRAIQDMQAKINSFDYQEMWSDTEKRKLADMYRWVVLNSFVGNEACNEDYLIFQNN